MNTDIETLYEILEEDEKKRHAAPCCMNCQCYFTDYGYSGCYKHDIPLEAESTDKCKDWN